MGRHNYPANTVPLVWVWPVPELLLRYSPTEPWVPAGLDVGSGERRVSIPETLLSVPGERTEFRWWCLRDSLLVSPRHRLSFNHRRAVLSGESGVGPGARGI